MAAKAKGKKCLESLINSKDVGTWKSYVNLYDKVFAAFCDKKSKSKLKALDKWFKEELGKSIRQRDPHHMLRDELIKLMEWKLTRGKFRPRLKQMVAENKEEEVAEITKGAFQCIGNMKQAIEKLCKLRAVGPATASAILTAYDPESYAFMADEAVSAILPGKIEYTLKYYLKYMDEVLKTSKSLSEKDPMTPHQVELALWTFKIADQMNIHVETRTTKRKSQDNDKKNSKKHKTSV